jgi:hypothetical protein
MKIRHQPLRRRILLLAAILCGLIAAHAWAQHPGPGRNISRPTISPYLQLLRTQDPILPNYHLYVRPRVELRNELSQGRASVQQLNQRVTAQSQRFAASAARPTGGAGGYLNYLHFYPNSR